MLMGKYINYIFGALLLLVIGTPVVFAQNTSVNLPFRTNERVVLEATETVERDFFAAGDRIEIEGNVNGDLYAAGGNIVVDGTVNGDVLAAGGNIEINGRVAGDVRSLGGNIEVNGTIGRNLTAAAGNISVDEEASVSGSAVFGAGNVEVAGTVGGNIVGGVGSLLVQNTVGGNIYTGVGQLQMDDGASVAGEVLYWSDQDALVDQNASISGALERRETPARADEQETRSFLNSFKLFSLLSIIAIGLLILRFFPGILEAGARTLEKKPWASLGFGFLKLFLEPIVAVLLLMTVVGIPLGIFLLFLYIMELYFAS